MGSRACAALGVALNNMSIGIGLGIAIGIVLGMTGNSAKNNPEDQ